MKTIMVLSIAITLLLVATVSADTVYSWTDEQGVQRFSNDPPPEGIENFEKFDSQTPPSQYEKDAHERRSSYDRMVQKASVETHNWNTSARPKRQPRQRRKNA